MVMKSNEVWLNLAEGVEVMKGNDAVVVEVSRQVDRQMRKWGIQSHSQAVWYAILGEEFGEVGKAVCELSLKARGATAVQNLREELVHTAAVCIAMAESLDRVGFDGP